MARYKDQFSGLLRGWLLLVLWCTISASLCVVPALSSCWPGKMRDAGELVRKKLSPKSLTRVLNRSVIEDQTA